jgi:PAS domain S-box-containing protein
MDGDSADRKGFATGSDPEPAPDSETVRGERTTILNSVPDALVLLRVEGADEIRVQRINERQAELFDTTPAAARGSTPTAAFGPEFGRRLRDNCRTSADDATTVTYEDTVRLDGEVTVWQTTLTPVADDGGARRVVGSSHEITDRARREQALERLHDVTRELMTATTREAAATIASETAAEVLDETMNGIHCYNGDASALVPVAWSAASAELLGGRPPALPVDDSLAGRVYRTGEPEAYADLDAATRRFADETPFHSELVVPLGDHGVFIFSSTTVDRFDRVDRTLTQVLAASLETTFDRIEQRRRLERQTERLDEFAGVVSHDLRNPLDVARGRLTLAREKQGGSDHLEAVDRAHERMETLIDDLLQLARNGGAMGDLEPVDLASIVRDCRRTVDLDGVSVDVTTDTRVRADRSRLKQLVENLLRNSVEHASASTRTESDGSAEDAPNTSGSEGTGRPVPDVTVRVGELDGGFFVEDDGPGIPPDAREAVFDAGHTSGGGNGLGLAIVERIADAHGWDIGVTAGSAGGARFEITGVTAE